MSMIEKTADSHCSRAVVSRSVILLLLLAPLLEGCLGQGGDVKAIEQTHQVYNDADEAFNSAKFDVSLQMYNDAIEQGRLNPDQYAAAYLKRGIALGHLGQVEEGVKSIDLAAQALPKREIHEAKAAVYRAAGDQAAAAAQLSAAKKR